MTKTKRIVLVVVDFFTVIGGLAALAVFIVFTVFRAGIFQSTPSHQEIYAASEATLRSELKLAVDHISFLQGTVEGWSGLLLFCGVVMFVGSILRVCFTPWRLK